MEQITRNEALRMIEAWPEHAKLFKEERDRRVIAAVDAGLTKLEVSKRMGIARSTVDDILDRHREQASDGVVDG